MGCVINLTADEHQLDLIDQAAKRLGITHSEFILDAACRKAEEMKLDQTVFTLSAEAFEKFQAMVENPPEPNEALRRLLLTKPRWE